MYNMSTNSQFGRILHGVLFSLFIWPVHDTLGQTRPDFSGVLTWATPRVVQSRRIENHPIGTWTRWEKQTVFGAQNLFPGRKTAVELLFA